MEKFHWKAKMVRILAISRMMRIGNLFASLLVSLPPFNVKRRLLEDSSQSLSQEHSWYLSLSLSLSLCLALSLFSTLFFSSKAISPDAVGSSRGPAGSLWPLAATYQTVIYQIMPVDFNGHYSSSCSQANRRPSGHIW